MNNKDNDIMIYEDKDGITKVNVKFVDEDVWLTQNHIASIYKTTQQNISSHIKNIYEDGELQDVSTHKNFLLVQKEGNRDVKIYYKLLNYLKNINGKLSEEDEKYYLEIIEEAML